MLIALSFMLLCNSKFNLGDLTSPAQMADCIACDSDISKFRLHLMESMRILSLYKTLDKKDRRLIVKDWIKENRKKHTFYQIQFSKSPLYRVSRLTDEMARVDFSKLDLLFLVDGAHPVFHTEQWLRSVYGCARTGNFMPNPSVKELPNISIASGSPLLEPLSASFEWFEKDESTLLLKWIDQDQKNGLLKQMSDERMANKINLAFSRTRRATAWAGQ